MSPTVALRRNSLAADIDRVVRRVVALVVLVALTALTGLAWSQYLRHEALTRDRPALAANEALLRDLLVAQSGMRAYAAGGHEEFLTDNVPDRAAIQREQQALDALAGPIDADRVRRQDETIDAWWAFRDRVVATRRSGRDAAALLPQTPFGQVQAANRSLGTVLTDRVQRGNHDITRLLYATAAAHVLAGLFLAVVVVRLRRRLLRDVLQPLEDLREVIDDDDPNRRAVCSRGPAEVRELARVVNGYRDQVARADEENAATVQRLESLDRQKTDFMATVSHELRTPLTSIAGYLEMLQDGDYGDLTAMQGKAVDVVERNTRRLRQLIEELLVLSRIDTAGVELKRRPVHFDELAGRVVENLLPQAGRGQVDLALEDVGPLGAVNGDPDQLERALTNVIGNAVKFTPAGGRVRVRVAEADGQQVVTVTDTGIGIPQADLADVGRRFFRAGNVTDQTIPGTGLGLAIVTAIMTSHGGSCRVESAEGRGTTVTLSLPQDWASPPA